MNVVAPLSSAAGGWKPDRSKPFLLNLVELLRQIQLQAVENCLQRNVEFLGAAVRAEQVSQPGRGRVAAEIGLTVLVRHDRVSLVERDLDRRGLGRSIRRLQQQMSEQKAAEGPIGSDDLLVAETLV